MSGAFSVDAPPPLTTLITATGGSIMSRGGGFGFDTPVAAAYGGDASYLQMLGEPETPVDGGEEGGFGYVRVHVVYAAR